MKHVFKQLVPPLAHALRWYHPRYGWKGHYPDFATAAAQAGGYDAAAILERIQQSTRKAMRGEIAFERDGIEYAKPETNFHLLSSLLRVAAEYDLHLNVLDFGGSLGTTYFQHRQHFSHLKSLHWSVVEQAHYVKAGQAEFASDQLHFYATINDCLAEQTPQIIVVNGVLQYIPDWKALVQEMAEAPIPYLLLDYVGYHHPERITIQHVPPVFYGVPASYACRFFDKADQWAFLEKFYRQVFSFTSSPDRYYIGLQPFYYEGQLWQHLPTL
ncbi:MAG: methyltransferase, TIGR04325 family [Sphingobacteriia bacterium]|nr:MAG: methyltransferase, TIGR04325 family [Sphingobacteriia bacterium]